MNRQVACKMKRVVGATLLLTAMTTYAEPADLPNLQPGQWAKISLNTINDVNPCPGDGCSYSAVEGISGVIDDWNGGAFATGIGTLGGLIVFGGGHNGYFGNEVYVFELDTQRWVRYSDPVLNPTCNYSTAELQDGSPCSMHTYDYVDYHPGTNSFVLLGATSLHEEGGRGVAIPHLFDLDTRTWRSGPKRPFGTGLFTGAYSAYVPDRDIFWIVQAYDSDISTYDPNGNNGAGSWKQYSNFNIDIDSASSIDPIHDLLVTVDGLNKNRIVVHDLTDPNAGPVTVSTSGDSKLQSETKIGFEWDPVMKSFVAWNGGASVHSLKPPSDNWRNNTWIWSRHDAAADNAVVPTAPNSNGTYSRWRYVPSLNAFIVVNRTSDPVFLYKLSEGQGEPPPPVEPTVAPMPPTNLRGNY